jgi:hypothetical protein
MSRSNVLGDQESLCLAKMLIEEHGSSAAQHARSNADRLMKVNDIEGRDSWEQIADAVDSLLEREGIGKLH